MLAVNALPTEKRVQDMNTLQWYWFYHNLRRKQLEEQGKDMDRLDYLGGYINPESAKRVMESKDRKIFEYMSDVGDNSSKEINPINRDRFDNGSEFIATDFENQLAEFGVIIDNNAYKTITKEGSEFKAQEIPDSSKGVGNSLETESEFLSRASAIFNEIKDVSQEIPLENNFDNKFSQEELDEMKRLGIDPNDLDIIDLE